MGKILPLEECSIRQIYLSGSERKTYQIPVYQRNYAWEEDEISALVKDVYDSFIKDSQKPYFIGTLVTYNRGDNHYEVIDGQQRLTTIYLLLKAMKVSPIQNELTYTARKNAAKTLKHLPEKYEDADPGIIKGYKFALAALDDISSKDKQKNSKFKEYFLDYVHIIHYQVPKDVDLNHYFEVMNSRGEQLEMHEIVKSRLCTVLKNKSDIATFSRVWEACSVMNVYIQQTFPDTSVFGKHLCDFNVRSFDEIPTQDELDGKKSIADLIENRSQTVIKKKETALTDKFQPIIDFPNFLLQVLKLTLYESDYYDEDLSDFILDDKELLNEFEKALKHFTDQKTFVKQFAYNLLYAKYLLDNFIVHHVEDSNERLGDNPWSLQHYYEDNSRRYTKNLTDDVDVQKELVHLLSMFEVTFTAKQRKNYLFYCLVHLYGDKDKKNEEKTNSFLAFLRQLADKYFYDVYLKKSRLNDRHQPVPNAFDQAILKKGELNTDIENNSKSPNQLFEKIYNQGDSNIPLFVFNYTDYKLWKKYASKMKGSTDKKGSHDREDFFKELGCSDFGLDTFNYFYFSRTRKSLEHFYPQANAVPDDEATGNALTVTQINCFGNFAMIGAETNSAGSNLYPVNKVTRYQDGKSNPISVASLKFKIMMQICLDNHKNDRELGLEWNADDISKHQAQMLKILFANI
jgi:hypothetical protein